MKKPVYLDNNATTMVAPEVFESMLPYFTDQYGNPSSIHQFGGSVGAKVREARAHVADLIGALPEEIVFTSCGTESDNTAIWSALKKRPNRRHIITSRVEHPAIKNLMEYFSKNGYRVSYVPVDKKGRLDMDYFKSRISEETAIVSIMWANNETGIIFPVEELAEMSHVHGALFHTDGVQAVGKIPIDLSQNKIDMLSLSAHKLHGPKGIGALYVRKGVPFSPFLVGGHQENGRRGGTENTPYIIGFGKAAQFCKGNLKTEATRISALRDRLEKGILANIDHAMINGDPAIRLPNTTSIAFEFVEGESILMLMDEFGICASSGSACTSGSLEPSHVLRAMSVPFTAAHGSIRFSFSVFNTEEEVDLVIEKLPPIIARLREMSPFWQEAKKNGNV